jgi:1,2-beta-oligoglucan phosphorylase
MKIQNSVGLSIEFLKSGLIKNILADPIRINLRNSTPFSRTGTNIYLRKISDNYEYIPLTGPESNSHFSIDRNNYIASGNWNSLEYRCILRLSEISQSWQWSIEITNKAGAELDIDLIYVQDVGLKPLSSALINEYYVSQYIERLILNDAKYGKVVCCRQNMNDPEGTRWLMLACNNGAVAASTDGMQLYGNRYRSTGVSEGLISHVLGGEYAGESSIIALQTKPFCLSSDNKHRIEFVAKYVSDHPLASSSEDLRLLPGLMLEFEAMLPDNRIKKKIFSPVKNIFNSSPILNSEDLNDEELTIFFGSGRAHLEKLKGKLLSFFNDEQYHVVLRAKEELVDRPHGHIMQAKAGLIPDENIMSTNTFAYGVFNSHLTQGNTNFNTLLSICSSQFNTSCETGQRIFVRVDGRLYLLGVPSAYEMGLNHSRWIYKHGQHIFQVRSWTSKEANQVNLDFKVIKGGSVSIVVSNHFDESNGWRVFKGSSSTEFVLKPKAQSMIAENFPDAQFRIIIHGPRSGFKIFREHYLPNYFLVLEAKKTSSFCMSLLGEVYSSSRPVKIVNSDKQWIHDCRQAMNEWRGLSLNLSLNGGHKDIAAIREIIPWYGINALTHYLTPYGLEQFGGAAWGTRDVSQGPIDLLLSLGKYDEAREVIRIILSNQNPDGSWPQWWMFDSYTDIRAEEAHGDIVYWCIMALCNYIKVTGDFGILGELLPYYSGNPSSEVEKTPVLEHIDRLIKTITDSFIPGTSLVPYGGGDWNDSLQPVSEQLAKRLISSWTVEMSYHAFSQYQKVSEMAGNLQKANELKDICRNIKSDINKYLIKDEVIAGYGLIDEDRTISLLLHPCDHKTGINYSLLPILRGIISGIFTPQQAKTHSEIIEKYLKGPDGARLMDRPLRYHGGVQKIFQRAESSTYFGREIGLMYVHKHIRYAESLAIMGKAEAFIKALRQAIPIDYHDIVPCGDFRQSNCYYSSSDVIFKNRYDADQRYYEVIEGKRSLNGGWRVYSSGPGIFIGVIIWRLLGLRVEYGNVIIDPVMPKSFNNFTVRMNFLGKPVEVVYRVKTREYGPNSLSINGESVPFTVSENPYREGGIQVPKSIFMRHLNGDGNEIVINM